MAVTSSLLVPLAERQLICVACSALKSLLNEYKSQIYTLDCGIDYYTAYREVSSFFIAYNIANSGDVDENCVDVIKLNNKLFALYRKYCRQPSLYCRDC